MADLSKITVESLPEAALLVRRWRVAQANAAARHYIPALREEGPLPQGLRPLLAGPGQGGSFTEEGNTYLFRRTDGEEAGELLVLFRPAPQATLSESQLDGLLRQLRQLLGELVVQCGGGRPADAGAVQKSLHRMFRLVENVEFLRDCAAGAPPCWNPVTIDLAGLCRKTAEGGIPLLREIGVQLKWDGPPSLLASGDPELLRRMVLELIANAARAVGRGQIWLGLRAVGDRAVLSLSDSGEALTQRQLSAMLEQDPGSGLPLPGQGAGLGLAVVRQIAALHGGSVLVEWSRGSPLVVISLPLGTGEARTQVKAPILQRDGGMSPFLVSLSELLPPVLFEQEARD